MQHSLTPTPPYAFSLRCELGTRHNSKYSKKFSNEIYFVSRLASTLKRCLYLSVVVGLSNVCLFVCLHSNSALVEVCYIVKVFFDVFSTVPNIVLIKTVLHQTCVLLSMCIFADRVLYQNRVFTEHKSTVSVFGTFLPAMPFC